MSANDQIIGSLQGFTPMDVSGLQIWLKADALGLSNNAAVSSWPDSSGNGKNLTLSATAPIYKTNQINGKPCVNFTRTLSHYLDIPSITYRTVFAVARSSAAKASTELTLIAKPGTFICGLFESGYIQGRSPNYNNFTPSIVNHNGFQVGPGSDRYNSDMFPFDDFWCMTYQASSGVTTVANLGSYSDNPTVYGWNGDIAEVLVYNTAVAAGDITSIENYLIGKYGLPQTPIQYLHAYDGDSIPRVSEQPFGYLLQPDLGKNWLYRNFSIGSQRTDQMQARQATTFAAYNAGYTRNILTVNIGTNDLTQSVSPTTAEGNLATWCAAARAVGFKVIVTTLVPNSNPGLPGSYDANRLTYNQRIRDNYTGYADALVDLAGDASLQTNPGANYSDGTHFSVAGHTLVASLLKPVIQGLA